MTGWIKTHRKILEHELLANDNNAYIVFTKLLLKVDKHTGTYVTGRFKLAELTNLKPTTAWAALQRLKNHKMVTLASDNKKTIITICNWSEYQAKPDTTHDNQMTTRRQPDDTKQEYRSKNKNTTNVVKTFGNADINSLISTFETEITPLTSRKQLQRYAAHRLLKKYPLAELERVIKAAAAVIDEQYAPQILSIEDLEQKLPKLAAYYKRKNKESEVLKV